VPYRLMPFRDIDNLIPSEQSDEKTWMICFLLKGQALSYFEHQIRRRLEVEDSELSENDLIELFVRELCLGLEYISKRATCVKIII
jgi:hypothetical protein